MKGGDVIPGGIKIENYDVSKVNIIWNGSSRKKTVEMSKDSKDLKKNFLEYIRALQDYNQKKNFGASLAMLCEIRMQTRRLDLYAMKIMTGCVNVVGTFGIGKSETAILLSK